MESMLTKLNYKQFVYRFLKENDITLTPYVKAVYNKRIMTCRRTDFLVSITNAFNMDFFEQFIDRLKVIVWHITENYLIKDKHYAYPLLELIGDGDKIDIAKLKECYFNSKYLFVSLAVNNSKKEHEKTLYRDLTQALLEIEKDFVYPSC